MKRDIIELKRSVNIVDIIGRTVSLKKRGHEWEGLCPWHGDKHASLKVNEKKQVFACFPCGKAGDVIDFLTLQGATMDEALKDLESAAGQVQTKKRSKETWKQVMPKDDIAFEITHFRFGKPAATWRYANERNELIGFVCRFNLADGKKETWPYTLCRCTENTEHPWKVGKVEWRWRGFDELRTLYNRCELAQRPDDFVLIVEGEKTCDAAKKLFPEFVCTTWQGGSNAVDKTNWLPLRDRKVIIWRDNDEPGFKAMMAIKGILQPITAHQVRAVNMSNGRIEFPKGWDLADPAPAAINIRDYLKSNLYYL